MKVQGQITHQAEGLVQWKVVNADGSIAKKSDGWQKNLILNMGMNEIALRRWANIADFAIAAEGTTPTKVSGGAITLTQSGQTVTASAPYFAGGDVGATIKFASGGVDAQIVTFNSTTEVIVNVSQSIGGGVNFDLFQTNQDESTFGAGEERTNQYLTGAGNCGTTTFGTSTVQYRRTFDFPTRGTPKTYTEVGFGWSGTLGSATVFSRILVQGGSVDVGVGQRLRLIYQINLTVGPVTPQALGSTIIGWPYGGAGADSANEQLQQMFNRAGLSYIETNGTTLNESPGSGIFWNGEPTALPKFFLSSVGTALSTFDTTPVDRGSGNTVSTPQASIALNSPAYVANTYFQIKHGKWETGEGNSTEIRSIVLGPFQSQYVWAMVLDNPQTKPNTHTLEVNVRFSWSRVLA